MKYAVDGRNPAPGNVQDPVIGIFAISTQNISSINSTSIFSEIKLVACKVMSRSKAYSNPPSQGRKKHSFLATTCFEIAATPRKWWVWRGQEIKTEFTLKSLKHDMIQDIQVLMWHVLIANFTMILSQVSPVLLIDRIFICFAAATLQP